MFLMLQIMSYLFMVSYSFAQTENPKWKLNISYATMKPFFENDQWLVTAEGYHLHPRTEDYTPGLSVGVERSVFKRITVELNLLYGLPPATLGVIDEYSASGREFLETQRFHFVALMVSPKFNIIKGHFGDLYCSPTIGYSFFSEKTMTPSFGPQVTWAKSDDPFYGVRAGFSKRLKHPLWCFNMEVLLLTAKMKIEENQTGQTLNTTFGPFGLLMGISHDFH